MRGFFLVLLGALCASLPLSTEAQVSESEFNSAMTSNGFSPPGGAYRGFISALSKASIGNNKMEAAMFLAQIIHESGGLRKKREDGCSGLSGCQNKYPASGEWNEECKGSRRPAGIGYYGRGYIQLTWCSNYLPASRELGLGDKLKSNPDSVAQDDNLAWAVSAWYWRRNVHSALGGSNEFGRTTKAINGQREECQGTGKNADKSRQRFRYYQKAFAAFRISGTPNEAGCRY